MITSQARSHFYAIGGGKPRRLSADVLPTVRPVRAADGSPVLAADGCPLFEGWALCKNGSPRHFVPTTNDGDSRVLFPHTPEYGGPIYRPPSFQLAPARPWWRIW